MTCRDVASFLDAYLDGRLPRLQRWTFDAHLALCPDCRNYLAGYQKSIALAKEALAAPLDEPAIPEELVQAILHAKARA